MPGSRSDFERAFRLRPFRADDAEALCGIHSEAILAIPDAVYARAERESWAAGLSPDLYRHAAGLDETFLVATDAADRPMGFVSVAGPKVMALYIAPTVQGRGIGGALLDRAEQAMRAKGIATAQVQSSLAALGFYYARNYVAKSRSTYRTRGGLVVATMDLEKPLRTPVPR